MYAHQHQMTLKTHNLYGRARIQNCPSSDALCMYKGKKGGYCTSPNPRIVSVMGHQVACQSVHPPEIVEDWKKGLTG